MLAEMFVSFKTLNNHIEYICAYPEIRLCKCDQIFTVIRINPHAVLQPYKSILTHKTPQAGPHALTFFRYVKDNDAPSPVPFSLLRYCRSFRFHLKQPFPFFCYSCIAFASFLFERNKPFRRETPEGGFRLVIKSRSLFVSGEKSKQLCRIR